MTTPQLIIVVIGTASTLLGIGWRFAVAYEKTERTHKILPDCNRRFKSLENETGKVRIRIHDHCSELNAMRLSIGEYHGDTKHVRESLDDLKSALSKLDGKFDKILMAAVRDRAKNGK